MPALESSAVSLYPDALSSEFYPRGKDDRTVITRRLRLVLTGQGGLTNTIPAAALGVDTLLECSNLYDEDSGIVYAAAVDPKENCVVIGNFDDGELVDVTSPEAYITITGTVISRGPA